MARRAVGRTTAGAECRVWWADLTDLRPWHARLLDPVEQARRAGFVREDDRRRFTLGVALTRLVLSGVLGVPAERVPLDRSCPDCGRAHGRPRLMSGDRTSVGLSLSHSAGRVGLAVCPGDGVGIDVEWLGRPLDVAALAAEALTAAEIAEFRLVRPEERHEAFLCCWTRKEAALKAVGVGLTTAPNLLSVSPRTAPPQLLGWQGRAELRDRLTLHQLSPGPGYLAHLAVVGAAPVRVTEQRAGQILAGSAR